jgi:hypothetical protein
MAAGLGSIVHGSVVGHVGFSPQAGSVGLLATLLYASWVVAMALLMWRRARLPREP